MNFKKKGYLFAIIFIAMTFCFGTSNAIAKETIVDGADFICNKYDLKPGETVSCALYVSNQNNVSFNSVEILTQTKLDFIGFNGFSFYENAACQKCPGCPCNYVYSLHSDNLITGKYSTLVASAKYTAPANAGKYEASMIINAGVGSIEENKINFEDVNVKKTLSKTFNVYDEDLTDPTGSVSLDCPKSQLTVGESMTCSLKVKSDNFYYNAIEYKSNKNLPISVEGKNGFEYSNIAIGACAKCIGYDCNCSKNNYLLSSTKVGPDGTNVIATVTVTAPNTPGNIVIDYPTTLMVVDYNNYDINNPVSTQSLKVNNINKVIKVVEQPEEPVVTSSAFSIIDCPKNELKVNESMTCTLLVNSENFGYNTVLLKSSKDRVIKIEGKNGYTIGEQIACLKCPGCGCSGSYFFINKQNIYNITGRNTIGTITVTPSFVGSYDLLFISVIGNSSTLEGGVPLFSGDTKTNILTQRITVVSDDEPTIVDSTDEPSTVTIPTTPGLDGDNYLKGLEIYSNGQIIPIEFNSERTQYNIFATGKDAEMKIVATLNSDKASFVDGFGSRNVSINYGLTTIYVKVQAENGSVRTYTINVNRSADDQSVSPITSIIVNGQTIEVQNGLYEYYVSVDEDVKYTDIKIEKSDSDNLINYSNTDLKEGNNTINIRVLDKDGNNYYYKLVVNRAINTSSNSNTTIVVVVLFIVVLILIGYLIYDLLKNKKRK